MKLRISKITLKNFKSFKDITINPNSDFNIIIGENNSGKSSIFEAIHLWEKCYTTYIQKSKTTEFYKAHSSTNRYVNYQELDFLRITKDDDLFHDPKDQELGKCSEITISLKNYEEHSQSWDLGFKITSPTSIENAFFRIQQIDGEQFKSFAASFCQSGRKLDEAIFIYQTRPVSGVHQHEPYYNEAQIRRKIQKGLSHEVLRNKIISKRKSISDLEKSISEILEKEVKFILPSPAKKDRDEYIELGIKVNESKPLDLHLQGSGFLQIAEILSTVEFIDAPIKLLLVDEPDSHIHLKLQQNLINNLRKIDHNQFFVISHNDGFVTNAQNNEVFFLNEDAKSNGRLEPIPSESFDTIKRSLGGVIVALEQLNNANKIIFVEGTDDELYLKALTSKLKSLRMTTPEGLSRAAFFPLRGKDNLLEKLEYNKRSLAHILKEKAWHVIFDRDFSTNETHSQLIKKSETKKFIPHSHIGYCIESVLFSDTEILKRFLLSLLHEPYDQAIFNQKIDETLTKIQSDAENMKINKTIEDRFKGQKHNRDESQSINFTDIIRSWSEGGSFRFELLMSKPLIKDFLISLEEKTGNKLIDRESDKEEEIASKLLNKYFDFISNTNDLFPSFQQLLQELNVLAEN